MQYYSAKNAECHYIMHVFCFMLNINEESKYFNADASRIWL